MEMALRRRLAGVATISISQQRQTAEVRFAPGSHLFSPAEFRAAVGEADVQILSFDIEACGKLEPAAPGAVGATGALVAGGAQWLVAGRNRFLLSGELPSGTDNVCISGGLDDERVIDVRNVRERGPVNP